MAEPYIAEVHAAQWTSDGIREAFRTAGFDVREWLLTQHLEKNVPADRIFFSQRFSKLFGLQYKAIYRNRQDFWPLDRAQHEVLQRYPWIFYCCSELKDVTEHGLALYFARFYRPRFEFQPELLTSKLFRGGYPYFRWGTFYRGLKECRVGVRVQSRDELSELLAPNVGAARFREVSQMGEFLLIDFEKRVVFAARQF
jgi:hypothetical protein